jgi:predicted ribosomally synthesized peptide with nif11-like leader
MEEPAMSKDALAGFMSKLAKDSALQEELRGLAEGSGDDAAVPTEAFVEFAQDKGFEFTAEEAMGVFEMSDDDLDSVSGGGVFAKYDGLEDKVGYKMMASRIGFKGSFVNLNKMLDIGVWKF